MSSGWLRIASYLIRMTNGDCSMSTGWHHAFVISYPDKIRPGANSPAWPKFQISLCHPDDIGQYRKSSVWHSTSTISHPDGIIWTPLWHDIGWHRMSSGWHTAFTKCHSDEIRCHDITEFRQSHPDELWSVIIVFSCKLISCIGLIMWVFHITIWMTSSGIKMYKNH